MPARRIPKKIWAPIADGMIPLLSALPKEKRRTITPDRGEEFSKHDFGAQALNGMPFYFPDPHSPWKRGTDESTNGLLREYPPKSFATALPSDYDISSFIKKLSFRPRKCLRWKTPYEVFYNLSLHLT